MCYIVQVLQDVLILALHLMVTATGFGSLTLLPMDATVDIYYQAVVLELVIQMEIGRAAFPGAYVSWTSLVFIEPQLHTIVQF